MKKRYPMYVGNESVLTERVIQVTDKFSGQVVSEVSMADPITIDLAIGKALGARQAMAQLPASERRSILEHCVSRFLERKDELVETLCVEAGKPKRDAENEVLRLVETFRVAAEEAVRDSVEILPEGKSERTRNYKVQWKRFPGGVCSFITPFNFPLNLVAHKIAPAIAAGCPWVLKPASLTPVSSLILGEILSETSLPQGSFSILPCHRDGADLFTTDPRFALLSFTGSPDVGWDLKRRAGKKKVVLELGGNAACIVDDDWDLQDAVERIRIGGFAQSGQSCISVQRVLVHEKVYEAFKSRLVTAVQSLKMGDPKRDDTVIGPIISDKEADRIESWIRSAMGSGARVLCGGKRQGRMIEATVLENVPETEKLWAEEAFGPIVVLRSFSDFDEALATVNRSRFGLQAGVLTRKTERAMRAWETLEVGGVIVGDSPAWRSDAMPYGGVKDSGLGREGVRFAMADMTEIRVLAIRPHPEK